MLHHVNHKRTVVAIGMATCDTYFRLNSLPVEDGKYCAQRVGCFCGGMAANVAINLSVLGNRVILIHSAGHDSNGYYIKESLEKHLSKDQVVTVQSPASFASLVFVEANTSRRVAVLTDGEFPDIIPQSQMMTLDLADFIYFDGSWPLDGNEFRNFKSKSKVDVLVNLEFRHKHLSNWHEWADYGVSSQQFVGAGEGAETEELVELMRSSCRSRAKLFGVTLGNKGALFLSEKTTFKIDASPVAAVDTNGAGDAFQAGLIHGLLNKWEYQCCLEFAAHLAAVKCMVLGPNLGMQTLEEISTKMELLHGH